MRLDFTAIVAGLAMLGAGALPVCGADGTQSEAIRIDIPVELREARVVFNLDHVAFDGDQPVGLQFIEVMVERFRSGPTKWQVVAIFHGPNGYMALADQTYDRVRHWTRGNPYKDQIAALQAAGVQVEMCAETMRLNGWGNAELLPGIKVNTGANFRLVDLVQKGFVEIHP